VKLLFNSVMIAWRSGRPNELTRSSVVGLPDGAGDASTDGFAEAAGLPAGATVGGGVCASAFIARHKLIRDNEVNCDIGNRCRPIAHFLIARKFEFRKPNLEFSLRATHSSVSRVS